MEENYLHKLAKFTKSELIKQVYDLECLLSYYMVGLKSIMKDVDPNDNKYTESLKHFNTLVQNRLTSDLFESNDCEKPKSNT